MQVVVRVLPIIQAVMEHTRVEVVVVITQTPIGRQELPGLQTQVEVVDQVETVVQELLLFVIEYKR